MSESVLKGNFKTKRDVKPVEKTSKDVSEQLKERALASLGGSMIYVDRTALDWDPDAKK